MKSRAFARIKRGSHLAWKPLSQFVRQGTSIGNGVISRGGRSRKPNRAYLYCDLDRGAQKKSFCFVYQTGMLTRVCQSKTSIGLRRECAAGRRSVGARKNLPYCSSPRALVCRLGLAWMFDIPRTRTAGVNTAGLKYAETVGHSHLPHNAMDVVLYGLFR